MHNDSRPNTHEERDKEIVRKMKETKEPKLEMTVKDAAIAVPAHSSDSQRSAITDAGTITNAYPNINESTAVAIAYELEKDEVGKHNIFIYDLGGGTSDVNLLTHKQEVRIMILEKHFHNSSTSVMRNQLLNYHVAHLPQHM